MQAVPWALALAAAGAIAALVAARVTRPDRRKQAPSSLAPPSSAAASRGWLEVEMALTASQERQGYTQLRAAAERGDSAAALRLLAAADGAVKQCRRLSALPLPPLCTAEYAGVELMLLVAAQQELAAKSGEGEASLLWARDSCGQLPLHVAARAGHSDLVELLLGAAPQTASATDRCGQTALHVAAYAGCTGAAAVLLEHARHAASMADIDGGLPLHTAAECGHAGVAKVLLQAVPEAALACCSRGIRELPTHLAAWNGHAAVLQLLLADAPETASASTSDGRTALHLACEQGHEEAIQLLLNAAPACVYIRDGDGHFPVHYAALNGQTAVVQLLRAAAPVTAAAVTLRGQTSLQLALSQQHWDTARCLLTAGTTEHVLQALAAAGPAAQPLFADLYTARPGLALEEWALVPSPCAGLGRALPAALARSPSQAAQLVARLPAEDKQCLQTAALCLGRRQRSSNLPAIVVWPVLVAVVG